MKKSVWCLSLGLHLLLIGCLSFWRPFRPVLKEPEAGPITAHFLFTPSASKSPSPAAALPSEPTPPPADVPPLAPFAQEIDRPAPITTTAQASTSTAAASPRAKPRAMRSVHGTAVAHATQPARSQGGSAAGDYEPPRYHSHPAPSYPAGARSARQQGVVYLSVSVDAAGHPESVSLKRSCGIPELDKAAERAVWRWEFEPARRGGITVAAAVDVPVRFSLSAL